MIDNFIGENSWLSNFYLCNIIYQGVLYPSVESAYHATKLDESDPFRIQFKNISPIQAERFAHLDTIRLTVMEELLRQKFAPGTELAKKLINTGDQELVEGNWWGDKFWGVSNGVGHNYLGKILMKIRKELNDH